MVSWPDAVRRAIDRFCERNRCERFTVRELVLGELPQIVRETGMRAARPSRTLGSWLRNLVRLGEIEDVAEGEYRRRRRPLLR